MADPRVIVGKLGMHRRWHPDDAEGAARIQAELDRANAEQAIRRIVKRTSLTREEIAELALEGADK